MEKATIRKLAEYITELTGTCPFDVFHFDVKSRCKNVCGERKKGVALCWIEWGYAQSELEKRVWLTVKGIRLGNKKKIK